MRSVKARPSEVSSFTNTFVGGKPTVAESMFRLESSALRACYNEAAIHREKRIVLRRRADGLPIAGSAKNETMIFAESCVADSMSAMPGRISRAQVENS